MPSFAAPTWLALGLPIVLLVAARLRALPRAHAGARRRLIQATMLLATLSVALAIARPELISRVDRVAVVFVLDRSRSVEGASPRAYEESLGLIREATRAMREEDLAGLVVFGADASTEVLPRAHPELGGGVTTPIARDGSDLDHALRRALADLPAAATPRIVLISDGLETAGDALEAAHVAASRGVSIDTLAIEREAQDELAVERVTTTPSVDPSEPFELRIATRSTRPTEVRVRVRRDGRAFAEATARIEAGLDTLALTDELSEPGVHRYDVELEPLDASADQSLENNVGGAFVRVTGRSRVLVLASHPEAARTLVQAVEAAGPEVTLGDGTAFPLTLAELASYDLVVLSDLNARALEAAQMSALRAYVRDLGGGLLMLGARDAFGLGGYARTPIEEALPATFDLRRRRDRASLAMAIAIDRSGSMTAEVAPGVSKLDLANEAAARSASLLSAMDRIAVLHVDTEASWTLPMTAVEDPSALGARIRRTRPGGGGIYVDVALESAYQALRAEQTQLRHLLLFSDGSDSEEMNQAPRLVAAAAHDGITTSVVSMGNGADSPALAALARTGGGRFYVVDDLRELPLVFTEETITASRSALVEEASAVTLGAPSDVTAGIDFASAPPLDGYALVEPRERATVLLGVRRQHPQPGDAPRDDPLLATFQFGVGRSAVFTTDAGGELARRWLAWPGFSALMGQLARSLARAPERGDAELDVAISGGRGAIRVEAMDDRGRFRDHLDLLATITLPGDLSEQVALEQTGPGRYEASFDGAAPGAYLVTIREASDEGTGAIVGSVGVVRGRADELRGEGTNHALLAQIASATGGRVRTSLGDVFRERAAPIEAHRPIAHELLLASMWLLLLSVALRRLVVPERVRAWLLRASRPRPRRAEPAPALATLEALRARRAREERPIAPELARALEATEPPRSSATSHEAPAATAEAPPSPSTSDARPPSAPTSLAESLLERRKQKR